MSKVEGSDFKLCGLTSESQVVGNSSDFCCASVVIKHRDNIICFVLLPSRKSHVFRLKLKTSGRV